MNLHSRAVAIGGDAGTVGAPTADQLAIINTMAMRPLSGDEVFVAPIRMSTDSLDLYGTIMDGETTLANFAADAAAGLPFFWGHNDWEMPFGRIFTGLVQQANGRTELIEWAYIQRGITLNGRSNDDTIRGIEGGTLTSSSQQFTLNPVAAPGSFFRCNIDGLDLFSDQCPHLLLDTTEDGTLVTATVMGAHQVEGSMVGIPANQDAGVARLLAKAADVLKRGKASPSFVRSLEDRYGAKIIDRSIYPAPAWGDKREADMPEIEVTPAPPVAPVPEATPTPEPPAQTATAPTTRDDAPADEARALVDDLAATLGCDPDDGAVTAAVTALQDAMSQIAGIVESATTAPADVAEAAEALATEAGEARSALINECATARGLALGTTSWNADAYRARLSKLTRAELAAELEDQNAARAARGIQPGAPIPIHSSAATDPTKPERLPMSVVDYAGLRI